MFNLPLFVLAETELSEAASSVTFTLSDYTIPTGSLHLAILVSARNSEGAVTDISVRFNGDTGSNYNMEELDGASTTASAVRTDSASSFAGIMRSPATASYFGGGMLIIPEYANTARHKLALALGGAVESNTRIAFGRWAATSAITSITILSGAGNFTANSRFTLALVDERYSIRSETLSGDGTFDIQNIPAPGNVEGDLAFLGVLRSDESSGNVEDDLYATLNNDTTHSHYDHQILRATDTGTSAAVNAGNRSMGRVINDVAAANVFSIIAGNLVQFALGNDDPHFVVLTGYHDTAAGRGEVNTLSGGRDDVEAINRFAVIPSSGGFKAASSLWLYRAPKPYLQRVVLTGTSALITFDNIPQDGDAIMVTVYGRSAEAAATDTVLLEIEDDTTDADYDVQYVRGDSTTVSAAQSAADRTVLVIPGDSAGADVWGGGMFIIPDYTDTDRHKHVISVGGPSFDMTETRSMRWENTAAIDKLELTLGGGSNFLANSIIELAVVKNLSFQNTTIKTRTRQT
jgi:hypothetical protein